MRIGLETARAYWSHPSQHAYGMTEANLTRDFEYRATSYVCLAFHPVMIPGVYGVHIGVKPQAWGHTVDPVRHLLKGFWADYQPWRVVAWIGNQHRQAASLARRTGFIEDGQFPGFKMYGWRL